MYQKSIPLLENNYRLSFVYLRLMIEICPKMYGLLLVRQLSL